MEGLLQGLVGAARAVAWLFVLYMLGFAAFNLECARHSDCRRFTLLAASRRAVPGLVFAFLAGASAALLAVEAPWGHPAVSALLYSAALLLVFGVYDSITMYLINGFTSLAVRGAAGPWIRARILLAAAAPYYWVMAGLALLLLGVGDLVLQPRSVVAPLAGSVLAAILLYLASRRAVDRWRWTIQYLEAVENGEMLRETVARLTRMSRAKPWIALLAGLGALLVGADRSGYAYLGAVMLYTIPVYRAVILYARHAFAEPRIRATIRGGGLEPEAEAAVRDLFYANTIDTATTALLVSWAPVLAGLAAYPSQGPALGAAALAGATLAYRRLYREIRGLNILAPVIVELGATLAAAIRRVYARACSSGEDCCMIARSGCEGSAPLAGRLVEKACEG